MVTVNWSDDEALDEYDKDTLPVSGNIFHNKQYITLQRSLSFSGLYSLYLVQVCFGLYTVPGTVYIVNNVLYGV